MPTFFDEVYALVRQVPVGRVTTYGAIACMAGRPNAPRAVGYALRALQADSDVPWQRVINAQGKVSPRGPDGEASFQRVRLEREGIVFDAQDRINLRAFGWVGPMPAPELP